MSVAVSLIHDLVLSGDLSAAEGAWVLELHRRILWQRRPWWSKLGAVVWRVFE